MSSAVCLIWQRFWTRVLLSMSKSSLSYFIYPVCSKDQLNAMSLDFSEIFIYGKKILLLFVQPMFGTVLILLLTQKKKKSPYSQGLTELLEVSSTSRMGSSCINCEILAFSLLICIVRALRPQENVRPLCDTCKKHKGE